MKRVSVAGVRVLIAEDDARLAALLCQVVEEAGWTAARCGDGGATIAEARTGAHDVLLLDWGLPGRDGAEVLRALRAEGNAIPVLLLTARASVRDRVTGLDIGADDYLAKPFDVEELLARLRALHRRASSVTGSQLSVGDLVLDLAARTVHRAGIRIELSGREFELLELLMRRRGSVLGRYAIAEHLWPDNDDIRSNVIDVHVAALRAKVDRPFGRSDIETVRGSGYRFGGDTAR